MVICLWTLNLNFLSFLVMRMLVLSPIGISVVVDQMFIFYPPFLLVIQFYFRNIFQMISTALTSSPWVVVDNQTNQIYRWTLLQVNSIICLFTNCRIKNDFSLRNTKNNSSPPSIKRIHYFAFSSWTVYILNIVFGSMGKVFCFIV